MKTASIEEKLEDLEIKGRVLLPKNRRDFSAKAIALLLYDQCPMTAPSLRTIQRAISELKDLGLEPILNPIFCGNTPIYSRLAAEMILAKLKFKVKQ